LDEFVVYKFYSENFGKIKNSPNPETFRKINTFSKDLRFSESLPKKKQKALLKTSGLMMLETTTKETKI